MNRQAHMLEQAHGELLASVKELEDLVRSPETFIRNYFSALRKEISSREETLLEDLDPAVAKNGSVSGQCQSMIELLNKHEEELIRKKSRHASSQTAAKYRDLLDEIKKSYHHARIEDALVQAKLEQFANLKVEIEDEISNVAYETLGRQRFLFIDTSSEKTSSFGRLMKIIGVNLSDSEVNWIKKDYYKFPIPDEIVEDKINSYKPNSIIQEINRLDSVRDRNLFRSKLPKNFFILNHFASKRPVSTKLTLPKTPLIPSKLTIENLNIQHIPNDAFAHCSNLKELYLSSNQIEKIWPDGLKGLTNLETLDLGYRNRIRAIDDLILRDLTSLKCLSLQNNCITSIHSKAFHSLKQLSELNLQGNQIRDLDKELFANSVSLKRLDLSYNQISSIDDALFFKCVALSELNLNSNKIERVNLESFSHLTCLTSLNLSSNEISQIACQTRAPRRLSTELSIRVDSSALTTLKLSNNKITYLGEGSFKCFISLESLFLNHNCISSIDQRAFDGLVSLQRLDLGFNHLEIVNPWTFSELKALKELSLIENRIKKLGENIFYRNENLVLLNGKNKSKSSAPKKELDKDPFVKMYSIDQQVHVNLSFSSWLLIFLCITCFALLFSVFAYTHLTYG